MLDKGGLDRIATFPALIDYLRDQLDWPIEEENFDNLTYDWDPKEFGLKVDELAGQVEIKQLRPIEREPWGIFFLSLPHKKIPVTVLRRILGSLAPKKRASANPADRAVWNKSDLLFIAAHGEGAGRGLAFAHFHEDKAHGDLPTLNVLGWDGADTIRRLSATHETLKNQLHWRDRGEGDDAWRSRWTSGFSEKQGEVVATSKAMAKELARLAREIRRRANELLAEENDQGPLRRLHAAFKEALIHDLKFDDFADMYAQTIAYGLLSARISRESGALVADNAADLAPPTNPFLKELLETFLQAGGRKGGMDFDELGVNDVVEMLRRANMEAVLRDFDDRNPNEDPVIHFYELFLREYDAKKRMQRGVFYTPRPVVSFIVRSVDEVLRTEFGLEDGLASTATWGEVIAAKPGIKLADGAKASDPFVRILDPATGTGTFLVETIDLIHARMEEKWRKGGKSKAEIATLWNDYVPNHLLPRLYGFELMMAPYAIAHMKLGLKLYETGYRFGSDARARIYLTNALEPAQDFDMQLAFMSEALAHEAQAANVAKETRFTVVIGNPPYAGNSSNRGHWIEGLINEYRFVDGKPLGEVKVWLRDDYVKFIRFSEHAVNHSAAGIIGLITNNSFIEGLTHRGMRQHLINSFDQLTIIDLHGDAKIKLPSHIERDENVFEIMQGVAVSILIKCAGLKRGVIFSDTYGLSDDKVKMLSGSIARSNGALLQAVGPNYFYRERQNSQPEYEGFEALKSIFALGGLGFQSHRDAFVTDISRSNLQDRMEDFFDLSQSDATVENRYGISSYRNFQVSTYRRKSPFAQAKIIRYQSRPFDYRYVYYDRDIVQEWQIKTHGPLLQPNVGLNSVRQTKAENWQHVMASSTPTPAVFIEIKDGSSQFPLWLDPQGTDGRRLPNIGSPFSNRLAHLTRLAWDDCIDAPRQTQLVGVVPPKPQQTAMFATHRERGDLTATFGPRDVFDWIYAVLHSPAYRARYADYLKSAFARVPLPRSRELFQALVPLGTKLVALHLLDADGAIELKDPKDVRFAGHGEARVEKAPEWSAAGGNRVTISAHRWFEGVPERVWDFHIGGYQPAQKWLKDRAKKGGKKSSPGRILTAEDQLHYRRMIVAMDKTIDLMAEIDRVIEANGGWPGAFKGMND